MFSSIQLVYFLRFLTPVKMALLPVVVVSTQDGNLKRERHSKRSGNLSVTHKCPCLEVEDDASCPALLNYYLNESSTPKHLSNNSVSETNFEIG